MSTKPLTIGLFRSPPESSAFSMTRYASDLAGAIELLDHADLTLRWVQSDRSALVEFLGGSSAPFPVRFWRRFVSGTLAARRSSFAVNHILDHANAHLLYGLDHRRTVISCHDIFRLKLWRGDIPGMPRMTHPPLAFMLSLSALKRAGAVITSTTATRDDLVEVLGVSEGRISVIPYGISKGFSPSDDDAGGAAHESDGRLSILVVDTGAPYKNQRAMIEVFARVRGVLGNAVSLEHVGSPLSSESLHRAEALDVADAIVDLGRVPVSHLPSIYRTASVLLFPSYYEGFGWPPLEAMASGLPVVCSTAAAVDEVVAGAALQADPDDHGTLAEHVLAVLSNDTLRASLRERGLARAASFSWERTALATLRVYGQVLGGAIE